jgi:hypothetical protein
VGDRRRTRPRAPSRVALVVGLLLALAICAFPWSGRCQAGACPSSLIGVDTSKADGIAGPILGEAEGETFLAADTLISSLTVWRIAPEDTSVWGWHLWITATDSTGAPAADRILLDGPVAYNFYGDGVHPIPIRFDFVPPFALPRPGKYYFALQPYPCGGFFDMLANNSNAYPDGDFWRNGRTSDCHLRNGPEEFRSVDVVFSLEFCDVSSPARSATWGELKSRYR